METITFSTMPEADKKALKSSLKLTRNFTLDEDIQEGKIVQLSENGHVENVLGVIPDIINNTITGPNLGTIAFNPNNPTTGLLCRGEPYSWYTYGMARIFSIVDGTIVVSSEFNYAKYDVVFYASICFSPHIPDIAIFAYGASYKGYCRIFNVSGPSPIGGEAFQFSSSISETHIKFDPNTPGKFLLAYTDGNRRLYLVVGTVSGETISYGTPMRVIDKVSYSPKIEYYPGVADKFILAYELEGDLHNIRIGTISGTVVTLNPIYKWHTIPSGQTVWFGLSMDPFIQNRFVILDGYGYMVIGTISGDELSFSTPQNVGNFPAGIVPTLALSKVDINTGIFIANYTFGSFKITPSSIVFYNLVTLIGGSGELYLNYIGNSRQFIISHRGYTLNWQGYEVIRLDSNKILGILQEAGTKDDSRPVLLMGGVDDHQDDLVINTLYYIHEDGTLTDTQGEDGILIGKAISENSIQTKPTF